MNLTIVLVGIAAIGLMLFLSGWLLALARQERRVTTAYKGAKALQRQVDLSRLVGLRRELEADEVGMASADAYLLYDVCQALRLSEGEAQHVVGAAYWMVIEAPVATAGIEELNDECGE